MSSSLAVEEGLGKGHTLHLHLLAPGPTAEEGLSTCPNWAAGRDDSPIPSRSRRSVAPESTSNFDSRDRARGSTFRYYGDSVPRSWLPTHWTITVVCTRGDTRCKPQVVCVSTPRTRVWEARGGVVVSGGTPHDGRGRVRDDGSGSGVEDPKTGLQGCCPGRKDGGAGTGCEHWRRSSRRRCRAKGRVKPWGSK